MNAAITFSCCLFTEGAAGGVCFADISTGEVYATSTTTAGELLSEVGRFLPSETLLGGDAVTDASLQGFLKERVDSIFSPLDAQAFDAEQAYALVETHFGAQAIEANGLGENGIVVRALGGLLHYLEETQKASLAD